MDAAKIRQSILAPPLTNPFACINSTATSAFILPLSNPPFPSNLPTSSLTSFPITQSLHAIDLTANSTRMPIHQQLTVPSTSTPQFSAAPYNIHEAMHALCPPTPSSLTSINETRDIHIPQFYLHAIPYDPTLTQLYMQETDYQFQIPARDSTKDHIYSRVTKATNPYGYRFKNNFNFMHLQTNLMKPDEFEFLTYPLRTLRLIRFSPQKNYTNILMETSILTTHCTLKKKHF